jgi:hypothetical protein
MDVWVKLKVSAPGVQHSQHACLSTQMVGIGGHLEQGLGHRPEEQIIYDPPISQCDRVEGIRECEDDMEVRRGQKVDRLLLQPLYRGRGLVGGTVAIGCDPKMRSCCSTLRLFLR